MKFYRQINKGIWSARAAWAADGVEEVDLSRTYDYSDVFASCDNGQAVFGGARSKF